MKKLNESFVCFNCWKNILKAYKTCRNHCPFCFASLHVDGNMPWDRSSNCGWKMLPVEYFISNGETKILFKCVKCWKNHYNKASLDDDLVNLDLLIHKYKFLVNS